MHQARNPHQIGQPHIAMNLGFEGKGRFYRGGEKEPGSHVYMCSAAHFGNYRNPLTHTLDRQPCISLL